MRLTDAVDLYNCLRDPALNRYMYNASPKRWFDIIAFVLAVKWRAFRGEAVYYVRELKETGRVISVTAAMNIDGHNAELGQWWIQEFWGSAVRREADVGIWETFLFEEVGIQRLYFKIDSANERAVAAARKTLYRYEGQEREDYQASGRAATWHRWSRCRSDPAAKWLVSYVREHFEWPPHKGVLDLPNMPLTP